MRARACVGTVHVMIALRSTIVVACFWAIVLVATRVLIAPAETCGNAALPRIRQAATSAAEWMTRAAQPGGKYVYGYDRESDLVSSGYNEVRHAGVTMALYQAAGRLDHTAALVAADAGVTWIEDRLKHRNGWAALPTPDGRRAKLGSTSLAVVALAERRAATGEDRYDALMRELGAFIAAMQRPDGGFHAIWLFDDDSVDTTATSRFYPGEALWALALLHEAFPGEGWDRRALDAARYLVEQRDEDEAIPFPPLPDHWLAYGLAEMAEWAPPADEAFVRALGGRFGLLIRTEAQEGGLRPVLGKPARLSGGSLGVLVEGLAAIWRLAAADPRLADMQPAIEERLACGAAILARRQAGAGEAAAASRPALTEGAWFHHGETRMDDQQHAFSGLLYAGDALEGRTHREPDGQLAAVSAALPRFGR